MAVRVVALSTMDVSTHRVSPGYPFAVFGVYLGLVILWGPLAHVVLYPREGSSEALPK
jgi:hypothetical protein